MLTLTFLDQEGHGPCCSQGFSDPRPPCGQVASGTGSRRPCGQSQPRALMPPRLRGGGGQPHTVRPLLALTGTHLLPPSCLPGCILCLAVPPLPSAPSAPLPANSSSLRVQTRAMFQGHLGTPTLLYPPWPPWPFPYNPHYLGFPVPLAASSEGPGLGHTPLRSPAQTQPNMSPRFWLPGCRITQRAIRFSAVRPTTPCCGLSTKSDEMPSRGWGGRPAASC